MDLKLSQEQRTSSNHTTKTGKTFTVRLNLSLVVSCTGQHWSKLQISLSLLLLLIKYCIMSFGKSRTHSKNRSINILLQQRVELKKLFKFIKYTPALTPRFIYNREADYLWLKFVKCWEASILPSRVGPWECAWGRATSLSIVAARYLPAVDPSG